MECSECVKYRDGWCRYKGIIDPASIKPDRNARTCRPVPIHGGEAERPDYGALDETIIATGYLGRKGHARMRNQIAMDIEEERNKW